MTPFDYAQGDKDTFIYQSKEHHMNGGEIIAQVLQKHGVKFLFTLCGGHISPIFVSAEKIGIRAVSYTHLTLPTNREV